VWSGSGISAVQRLMIEEALGRRLLGLKWPPDLGPEAGLIDVKSEHFLLVPLSTPLRARTFPTSSS